MSFESSFVWVEPRVLAFGEVPGRWRLIQEDLDFLRREGIGTIVSLLEDDRNIVCYRDNAFECCHLPVVDFTPPAPEQIRTCMNIIADAKRSSRPTYVHCMAGIGRSGTIAAAWLIHSGMNAMEAIQTVRRLKAGTIESESQWNALLEFAATL